MSCPQSRFVSAYLDRELDGGEMLSLRRHMEECSECRAELEELRLARHALRGLCEVEPSAGFEDRLRVAVMGRPAAVPRPRLALIGAMAVSSCAAALAAWFVFHSQSRPPAPGFASREPAFEASSDLAYGVGSDAFSSHVPVVTASSPAPR